MFSKSHVIELLVQATVHSALVIMLEQVLHAAVGA